MPNTLDIALAQLNPVMGDFAGNVALIRKARAQAGDADVIIFTELVVTGYPPEDLVLKPSFQIAVDEALADLAQETKDGGPGYLKIGRASCRERV